MFSKSDTCYELYPLPVIAFCGHTGSGKDTAAKTLTDRGWLRVAFADEVRAELESLNPQIAKLGRLNKILEDCGGWDPAKRQYPEIRRLLQNHGEKRKEKSDPDIWIWKAEAAILLAIECGKVNATRGIVVSDVRCENEAEWVLEIGGTLIRIDRPGARPANDHPVESLVDDLAAEMVIKNDGDINKLRMSVIHAAITFYLPWYEGEKRIRSESSDHSSCSIL